MKEESLLCCSCWWNHGNDSFNGYIYAMEIRIRHVRRLLTTAFHESNISGYKGLGAMWFMDMVLLHGLSGRRSSSSDGVTRIDDKLKDGGSPRQVSGDYIFCLVGRDSSSEG